MLLRSKFRQDTYAVLAIVSGLCLTTTCWADTYDWPASVGRNPSAPGSCFTFRGGCGGWDTACHPRGSDTTNYPDRLYFCGDATGLSVKADAIRVYGYCMSMGAGNCVKWDQFFCVHWNVWLEHCDDIGGLQTILCSDYWYISGCDPLNPNPPSPGG
jgi:hypothetical protein